ncbi:hypothetical protein, partial [Pseudomonas sp. F1002]
SLSSFAASTSTGPTNPIGSPENPATQKSQDSMGTGSKAIDGGSTVDPSGTDPRVQGNDQNRQGLGTDVENGKMGTGTGKSVTPGGDDSNVPGAPKQPHP